MAYLGRIIAIGSTIENKPCCVYAVSGRSEASKNRKAVLKDEKITIEPINTIAEHQRDKSSLLFYDCLIIKNNPPIAVIGNGKQVSSIFNISKEENFKTKILNVLKESGSEPDKYNTPRIVGSLTKSDKQNWVCFLGIITLHNKSVMQLSIPKNMWVYISTYTGKSSEPEAPKFSDIKEIIKNIKMKGNTARDLAESLFEWVDPEYIICTASAVWTGNLWELAIKNR